MSTRASPSATTLRGRWLRLARVAWLIIATLALGLFLASIPAYVSNVLTLGQADWMGAPVEAPAGLVFVLDLLGVLASIAAALVCLTLAVVLFWRRSDDWMVMFISSYLLLYGTIMAGPLEWAEAFYPAWPVLAVDVVQPLLLTTPTGVLVLVSRSSGLPPHRIHGEVGCRAHRLPGRRSGGGRTARLRSAPRLERAARAEAVA